MGSELPLVLLFKATVASVPVWDMLDATVASVPVTDMMDGGTHTACTHQLFPATP